MDNLDILRDHGFVPWDSLISTDKTNVVYCWANEDATVCIGKATKKPQKQKKHNNNDGRTYPELSKEKIYIVKDSGKSIIAGMVGKITNKPMKLYGQFDSGVKSSQLTSRLETRLKEQLTGGKEIKICDEFFHKKEFIEKKIKQQIVDKWGFDSQEAIICSNSGDGDAWCMQSEHPKSKKALENIIDTFCLFE